MKITIIGGGSYRVLGIIRSALAVPGMLAKGEVYLYDLNVGRAEALGRLLLKSPEHRETGCAVKWGDNLAEALTGADVVGTILPAMRPQAYMLADEPSLTRGYINSDNVSPGGDLCGITIAPVVLNIAREMEKLCPSAWLINFVNPVAVISGMVNNHTKIKALGVCGGFTNHLWDIARIFGQDEESAELQVEAAGINHISYILRGTWQGKELFGELNKRVTPDWQMCELQPWWNDGAKKMITNSVTKLVRFWRDLGVLVFSTEGDGMAHLMYDEWVANDRANFKPVTAADADAAAAKSRASRLEDDRTFQAPLKEELTDDFWQNHWHRSGDQRFKRADQDIFVRIFKAVSGVEKLSIATSRPNQGAIAGIKDRHVVEYSQVLFKDTIRSASAAPYEIPDIVQGLTAGLAAHQTMLGDALATEDPRLMARAMMSYPVRPYSKDLRDLWKDLINIAGAHIKPAYAQAAEYL
ncbi:MAG: hypothetical protein LBK71_00840 [Verrucomicrobiales bacterium]|jgi:alpha-galactosidase/6-phospho-beta-glucosidase family protein|nr:hypothetical protein [Verrucomicrobiales bacterium]